MVNLATLSISLAESGTIAAKDLVAQILVFAKERGIDQATLAARSGISAEALSRLKKSGGCRLETALALVRATGVGALELSLPVGDRAASALSARKLSAGRRVPISEAELVVALRTGRSSDSHRAHLYGFFEELPIELVHDVILDENLDYSHLSSLAGALGAEGETVDWLAEMAGDGVADAA